MISALGSATPRTTTVRYQSFTTSNLLEKHNIASVSSGVHLNLVSVYPRTQDFVESMYRPVISLQFCPRTVENDLING